MIFQQEIGATFESIVQSGAAVTNTTGHYRGGHRISNLDVAPGFAAAAPVLPGQAGFPASLVRPDRNNSRPRIGIAWKPTKQMVVERATDQLQPGAIRDDDPELRVSTALRGSGDEFQKSMALLPATR